MFTPMIELNTPTMELATPIKELAMPTMVLATPTWQVKFRAVLMDFHMMQELWSGWSLGQHTHVPCWKER